MGTFSLSHCGQYKQASTKELDALKTKLETLFVHSQLFRRLYQDAEKKLAKIRQKWNTSGK